MGLFDIFKKSKKVKLVDELQYGDIVWCKIDETKKFHFEDEHKMRPCTFLYKDNQYIYVFTHSHIKRDNNISHYLGERLGGSILTNEVIKVKHKSCKNRFDGQYTKSELNNLTKYFYGLYKKDELLSNLFKQNIAYFPGDLVVLDGEKYLVKKSMGAQVSLLKFVAKGKRGVPFKYKDNQFLLSKDAVVYDSSRVEYVEGYGKGVIDAFETAKREKTIKIKESKKETTYEIGDIIVVGNEEKLIIDIYNENIILVDDDYKCSCELKENKFKVVENIGVKEVNKIKRVIDYSDMKRSDILLCKRKR